jgi:hypothetical protein
MAQTEVLYVRDLVASGGNRPNSDISIRQRLTQASIPHPITAAFLTLPAPTEQTHLTEAGGEEKGRGGQRSRGRCHE